MFLYIHVIAFRDPLCSISRLIRGLACPQKGTRSFNNHTDLHGCFLAWLHDDSDIIPKPF